MIDGRTLRRREVKSGEEGLGFERSHTSNESVWRMAATAEARKMMRIIGGATAAAGDEEFLGDGNSLRE
ncbi:unnamed protein product [Soboliphyme baturini]|uniref:Uncharacterized protein n=1 Tax=Soboliphyme baturini TaxID=241478 RepID=A0A183IUP3_9BILA|nr:unnamed protein product [Soboliphyme baturini]